MAINDLIGRRLTDLGIPVDTTLARLSRKLGLNYKHVWRWSHNPWSVSVRTAARFCRALGISLDELYRDPPA